MLLLNEVMTNVASFSLGRFILSARARISFVRQRLRCHILGDPSEDGSVDDATYFLKQFLNRVASHLNLGRLCGSSKKPARLLGGA